MQTDIKLFKRQRVEQLEAIKSFLKISNYEKQHSMIMLMAEKLFSVIQDSRAVIEASSYIPGVSDFPLDDEVRNALSNILENTALFSEIILRYERLNKYLRYFFLQLILNRFTFELQEFGSLI